jgi:hypothetical protein
MRDIEEISETEAGEVLVLVQETRGGRWIRGVFANKAALHHFHEERLTGFERAHVHVERFGVRHE